MDPARPLVQNHGTQAFRLTRDDAAHVQTILTNAGFLGQSALTGSINYCVNGGRDQPYCTGNRISTSMTQNPIYSRLSFNFNIFIRLQKDPVVVIFSAFAISPTPLCTTKNLSASRVREDVWWITNFHLFTTR